jgi:hypothetical protein
MDNLAQWQLLQIKNNNHQIHLGLYLLAITFVLILFYFYHDELLILLHRIIDNLDLFRVNESIYVLLKMLDFIHQQILYYFVYIVLKVMQIFIIIMNHNWNIVAEFMEFFVYLNALIFIFISYYYFYYLNNYYFHIITYIFKFLFEISIDFLYNHFLIIIKFYYFIFSVMLGYLFLYQFSLILILLINLLFIFYFCFQIQYLWKYFVCFNYCSQNFLIFQEHFICLIVHLSQLQINLKFLNNLNFAIINLSLILKFP